MAKMVQITRNEYRHFRNMSYQELVLYLMRFYKIAYQDGMEDQLKQIEKDQKEMLKLDDEELYRILLEIPGIGEKRAEKILDRLFCEQEKEH